MRRSGTEFGAKSAFRFVKQNFSKRNAAFRSVEQHFLKEMRLFAAEFLQECAFRFVTKLTVLSAP